MRINTTGLSVDTDIPHNDPSNLATPARDRVRTISQAMLPSLMVTGIGSSERHNVPPKMSNAAIPHGASKARNESRKLLSHILGQLHRRPKPPAVLGSVESQSNLPGKGLSAVVRTVKGITAVSGGAANERRIVGEDSDDEDAVEDSRFYTDVTYDLMIQLRDVLLISVEQDWDIFAERWAIAALAYILVSVLTHLAARIPPRRICGVYQPIGHPRFYEDAVCKGAPSVRGRVLLHLSEKHKSSPLNFYRNAYPFLLLSSVMIADIMSLLRD